MAGLFTPIFLIPGTSVPITPPPEQTAFSRAKPAEQASAALPPPPALPTELLKALSVEALVGRQHGAGSLPTAAFPTAPTAPTPAPEPAESSAPQPPVQPAQPDPRYVSLVSRIANYYQQRTHAIANYQEQRCRAWANMHRQKCQEMTKAATLVVAWYIRDRIGRRRRRQKKQFTTALAQRQSGNRVAKTDRVRNWVAEVPDGPPNADAVGPRHAESLVDPAEANFDVNDAAPDKDSKLWTEADALIRANMGTINVPFLGHLSFERSDSGSDEDEDDNEDYDDDGMDLEDELGAGLEAACPLAQSGGDKEGGARSGEAGLPPRAAGAADLAPPPQCGGRPADASSTSVAVQPGTRRDSDLRTASHLLS